MRWLRLLFGPRWLRRREKALMTEWWAEEYTARNSMAQATYCWLGAALLHWESAASGPPSRRSDSYEDAERCARHATTAAERLADILMWKSIPGGGNRGTDTNNQA